MSGGWRYRLNDVANRNLAAGGDDGHDAGPERQRGRVVDQARLQSGLKAVDQDAGGPKACQANDSRRADPKRRIERQVFQVEAHRRDVLAELTGGDLAVLGPERVEQLDGMR